MFLTPKQTGGPAVFSLRQHNRYLAIEHKVGNWLDMGKVREFDIRQLAQVLGQPAGETWQAHAQVILIACYDGKLFEWLDKIGDGDDSN